MTVIDLCPETSVQRSPEAVPITKLATVVHGDRPEDPREVAPELTLQFIQDLHHAGSRFVRDLENQIMPGNTFREYQQRSPLTGGAANKIHLPMPDLRPVIDILRASVDRRGFLNTLGAGTLFFLLASVALDQ